jgi:hypothetical protein
MKAEHVKTPQNTEEVSSHPGKKGIGAKKAIGIPPVSEKNRGRTGKKACKFGRREDNHETGKNQFIYAMNIKSNGKSRINPSTFETEGGQEKRLANLWRRNRIKKNAHAVRGQESNGTSQVNC